MNGAGIKTRKTLSGFGIVEIMVAMTISLVLLIGVVEIFSGSKKSYSMTENLSRMQENGRFAMDALVRHIRMAGFLPCKTSGNIVNTLNSTSPMLDFFGGAIKGYEGGVSAFPATFPASGTSPGDRVATSDAIIVLKGGDETYHVTSHVANAATVHLGKEHNLNPGQVVMMCDGENAAIFQITNSNQSNKTIVHNEGAGSPGNCTKAMGGSGDCSNQAGIQSTAYTDGGQVVTFEGHAYYVGVSSSGSTYSLYRKSVLDDATTSDAQELLEGIESMQLLYGEDANGDKLAERYVTADAVGNWNTVVSVRLGLLVHSPETVSPETDTRQYNVAGTVIGTATAVQHEADKRLRYAFNSTIKLRNRGI